jgi:hypothetical protein
MAGTRLRPGVANGQSERGGMKRLLLLIGLALVSLPAFADLSDKLEELVGYTIVGTETIEGWYDSDGKKGDSFEGCDYGRTIVFSDNRILHCSTYSYHYASRPTAIILSNGRQIKMVVDDELFDMQR